MAHCHPILSAYCLLLCVLRPLHVRTPSLSSLCFSLSVCLSLPLSLFFLLLFLSLAGEAIEVLDIGLRNSRNYNAVHRVRPSPSSQRIASTPASPQKSQGKLYHKGVSKSSYAISSYGRDSSNSIGTRSSGNIGYTSYYSSPNHRASLHSHKETPGREQTLAGLQGKLMQAYHHKLPQQSAMEAVESSHQRKSSVSSSNTSSSGASPSHIVPFSSKVPPPNIMARGLRESSNESSPKHSSREGSSTKGEGKEEEMAGEERWKKASSREFVVREGLLHRSRAFRGQSPKLSGSKDGGSGGRRRRREYLTTDVRGSEGRVPSEADSDIGPLPSTTIKQSRHYRKIDLRPEKPLFDTKDNNPGSSDEESDSTVSEGTGKSNPGIVPVSPPASKQFRTVLTDPIHFPSPIPSRFGKNGRRRNFSGPPISGGKSAGSHSPFGLRERLERGRIGGGGRWGVGGVGGIGGWGWERNSDQFETEVGRSRFYRPLSSTRPPVPVNMPHRVHSLENLGGHFSTARTNNYCQVAILEKDEGALSGITSHKAGIASRKLSDILSKPSQPPFSHSPDYDFQLPTPNASSPFEEDTNEEGGGEVGWDYPYAHHLDHDIQLSPPRSPLFDDYDENFELPARGTDSFLYNTSSSLQSPIDNIIAPPVIFDIHSPLGGLRNETISEEGEVASDSEHTENDPQNTVAMGDRNSTESNDTGYTSGHGASPGCQDRKNLSTVEEFGAAESENLATASSDSNAKSTAVPASPQDVLADLSISSVRNSQSGNSIHHSQTSLTSTDSVRCYIPLVFQRKGRGGRGSRKGVSIYIAVCLVENSDQIIKVRDPGTLLLCMQAENLCQHSPKLLLCETAEGILTSYVESLFACTHKGYQCASCALLREHLSVHVRWPFHSSLSQFVPVHTLQRIPYMQMCVVPTISVHPVCVTSGEVEHLTLLSYVTGTQLFPGVHTL